MASEATVGCGLQIRVGSIEYRALPSQFRADVAEGTGPVPGELTVTYAGKDVDLSGITTPGLCRIQNRSTTEYVLVGVHDGASFFPLLELLPGESYVMRLTRHLGDEFTGTGTGTPSDVNVLHLKVTGSTSARVLVEVFGK